jgi:hypothetical protein
MGRSGDVGREVELFHEKMKDRENFKILLYNTADDLAKRHDLPGWSYVMDRFGAKASQPTAGHQKMGERELLKIIL